MDEQKKPDSTQRNNYMGAGVAIGVGVGAAIGVATDNLAVGVGIGAAIGVALGAGLSQQQRKNDDR